MKHYLVAERYAGSLDRALDSNDARDAAAKALRNMSKLYQSMREFQSVLSNPAIPVDQRAAVLRAVAEREETPEAVQNLLNTLLQRGRITVLPEVARVFATMTDQRLNRVGALVTTACELTEEQADRLVGALQTYTGATVRADFEVNPDILGGVVAHIQGKVIDGSLRARIQRMKHALLGEEKLGG